MNLYVVAVCIPLVFCAELTDKTMFAGLLLATQRRARDVWIGAAAAFAVQIAISVSLGPLIFRLIPHILSTELLATGCIVGGAFTWRSSNYRSDEDSMGSHVGRRVVLGAFSVIFLAEMGDLTQVLIVGLATRYRSPLSVALGAVVALWLAAGLAVAGSRPLLQRLGPSLLHKISAGALIFFGLATGLSYML
ncbi:MAG: TMEM165/GDT1 family protein [Acidimicrobiales bacterium]